MEWRKMKIFISGGTGFLGKALAEKLLNEKHTVSIYGRNIENVRDLISNGAIFVKGSLNNTTLLINSLKSCDVCVHCAALSSLWGKKDVFYEVNVKGTQNILNAAHLNKIKRFIHISSPSIYFRYKDQYNISEKDFSPEKFSNYYAQTKWLSEIEVSKFYDQMQCIILRPRAIFGHGDTALLPRLLAANKRIGIPCRNGANFLVDITHIDNVVHAICLAMESDASTCSKAYNISNGEPMTLRSILNILSTEIDQKFKYISIPWPLLSIVSSGIEYIFKRLGLSEPLITKYSAGLLSFGQTLNIDSARKNLKYAPVKSIHDGLKEYARGS